MSSNIIEIGIIGDTLTGKTSLINYYTGLGFRDNSSNTVGIDCYIKKIKFRKKEYRLKIYDTAGQEIYHNLALNIFKKCRGLILVYSIDNNNSFDNVKDKWIKDIDDLLDSKIPIILVGNKKDLEKKRIISEKDGLEIATKNKFFFYETSAKTGENVNQIFQYLFEQIINIEIIEKDNNNNNNDNDNNNNNKDDGKENNKSKKSKKCIIF